MELIVLVLPVLSRMPMMVKFLNGPAGNIDPTVKFSLSARPRPTSMTLVSLSSKNLPCTFHQGFSSLTSSIFMPKTT